MNKEEIYLTKEGHEKLKEEYRQLTEEKRSKVAARIKEARELGDISENAEYDAAREEQAFVEGRIVELRTLLAHAKIVEDKKRADGYVKVGSKVRVHIDGEETEFELVGAEEADPLKNKVSHESPLGKALIGRRIGEKVEVEAPVGKIFYKILSVS